MWTIYRRELGQFFASPVAYLIAFAFLLLTGLIFNYDITASLTQRSVDPAVIPKAMALYIVLFAPVITMRSLAEESREGTLELLLTAPIHESAIVFAKFLSVWTFYTVLLLLTLVYQVILVSISAAPDLGMTVASYIGIWLYGGAALAVGLLFSAVTENQIVAAFLGFIALTLLWLGDQAGEIVASIDLARVIRNLTLPGHFRASFAVGLLRLEDVVYYAGLIVIMLFITIRIVESRRWR